MLVQRIVNRVSEILSHMPSNAGYHDKLVGIDWRAEKVKLLLDTDVDDRNWTIGIWGMAGIGKTTHAGIVFTEIKAKFDAHFFVSNVKEQIRKETRIVLRDKMISSLLGDENLKIGTPLLVLDDWIMRRLQRKRVLIVFDDVDDSNDLDLLAGNCSLCRKGSRIIITSTDRQVLQNVCHEEHICRVKGLSNQEDLQLFSLHAFHQNEPKEGYIELSQQVISYAQGNPLALKVLGSNLYGKETEYWESQLLKLKSIPNKRIQDILKVSYERLDRDEQRIFLDIACLFERSHISEVEKLLESFGFFARSGMRSLVDKSLIEILHFTVFMHNLLQQMGKEIVNEESKEPGGRSRLWNPKDISHVFKTNSGTEKIECISLVMSKVESISSTAFRRMANLRFLYMYDHYSSERNILPHGLDFLPEQLRYLYWHFYPLESLPLKFCPNNLVELHLPNSQLKQLWDGDNKPLGNLKVVDLNGSKSLIRISDSFEAPNLEELYLEGCESLVEIPSSLKYSRNLAWVELKGCVSICSLPTCIQLENLESLNLEGCLKLEECPEIPCNIRYLYFCGTAIKPSSIGNCFQLVELYLSDCKELENLPSCIGQLKSLKHLILIRCSKLSCLPQSICQLKSLEAIDVTDCLKLEELPKNFGDLKSLRRLKAKRSGIKALPPSINQLSKLQYLCCKRCEGLTKLPPLSGLNCLWQLYLNKCGLSEIPESIGSLLSLEELHLIGNSFETIPASIKQLSELKVLDLSDCKKLRNLPELPWLMSLVASNCTSLEFISYPFLSLKDQDEEAFVEYIYVKHGEYLDFRNCIKLGKDVCLKIMETALSGCLNKKKFRLYIPWVEVLPRMRYWTSECHLSFKLEREDILGFCFCAVIDPQLLNSHRSLITCLAKLEYKSGMIYDFHFPEIKLMSKKLDSKHVFLLYETLNCEHFTQASFQFAIEDYDYNTKKYVKVLSKGMIQCGVHPISWKQYRTQLIPKLEMIKTKKDGIGIRE
ncbi:hypothetical protein JCGZ_04985 [Jatropha curcas]|uniref:Uncharacterized protein n=1 Tax=Jatropha curcas TaxID=180498 RepID=A0A067KV39_JATCU|nr:hypothetical protein JCGZ_04985 [Jatropha curcas]